MAAWQTAVHKWYPKLHQRAYFVPPVQTNRLQYGTQQVSGETVHVPLPPVNEAAARTSEVLVTDVREDQAQQRILHCLKTLTERRHEVMFVMARLQFSQYLDEPCYVHSGRKLPRPRDLKKENMDRGDFDLLIIHRHYGLVACEIKSVGDNFHTLSKSEEEKDKILGKKIQQAAKQLNKSGAVLQHLLSDLVTSPPRVWKCLMLPSIPAEQLQRVLQNDAKTNQILCQCLGTSDPADQCLTSDRVSPAGPEFRQVSQEVLHNLELWWAAMMTSPGHDSAMSEQMYEELLARFVGPATRVEIFGPDVYSKKPVVVRTEGQGVSETGERLTKEIILHPEQIKALSSGGRLVYITGPPGTGKTVVLMLKGLQWLREKNDVHVVSMYIESVAASKHIGKWLESRSGPGCKVHRHVYHLAIHGNDKAVDELAAFAKQGYLYVIVDEVDGSEFEDFFSKLTHRVPHLHMWVARVFHDKIPNGVTDQFRLTKPLRCPAVIVNEIQGPLKTWTQLVPVGLYSEDVVQPCEGPLTRTLCHQGGQHTRDAKPLGCETCGRNVASVLRELHVNETVPGSTTPGLQFGDVFVLTSRWAAFWDAETDSQGAETVPACGLIRGLRGAGLPVRVVKWNASSIDDVCSTTRPNDVVAAQVIHVSGLERKVVVWVPSRHSDGIDEELDRLNAFGRSTGQLIKVTWPRAERIPVEDLDLD